MYYEASSYGWDIFYIIRNLLIYSQQLGRQSCGKEGEGVQYSFDICWIWWDLQIFGEKTSQESMVDVPRMSLLSIRYTLSAII